MPEDPRRAVRRSAGMAGVELFEQGDSCPSSGQLLGRGRPHHATADHRDVQAIAQTSHSLANASWSVPLNADAVVTSTVEVGVTSCSFGSRGNADE